MNDCYISFILNVIYKALLLQNNNALLSNNDNLLYWNGVIDFRIRNRVENVANTTRRQPAGSKVNRQVARDTFELENR